MAGFKLRRALIAHLNDRARRHLGPGHTGFDYLLDWLRNGGTVQSLTEDLNRPANPSDPPFRQGCSRSLVYTATRHIATRDMGMTLEEANAAVEAAKKEQAEALMDEAKALADKVAPEREELDKAKLQVQIREKMARALDRDTWGERPPATINVTLGSLHLDALRVAAVQELPEATTEVKPLPPAENELDEVDEFGTGR